MRGYRAISLQTLAISADGRNQVTGWRGGYGARYTRSPPMPADRIAHAAWQTIADRLRASLNEATYTTWFANAEPIESSGRRLVLGVPNDFTKTWIEGHFASLLDAAAAEHDLVVELRVAMSEALAAASAAGGRESEAEAESEEAELDREAAPDDPDDVGRAIVAGLNPKYTFDVFVIGSSNRFAHAAALAVAESPAQAYNPLFIYGSTGLGKTHLLHAVGHYVQRQHPHLAVRYVTTETVLNDFIDALRDKTIDAFKQRYRTYDVLLIDDIQFLEGKVRFQEEFFHTFNSLYEAGKQIVISSDRQPRQIAELEARLRSRFEWGLITDVQPPDLETRIAILRKKVKTDGIAIADPEVLTSIAARVESNIRELEGALTRVIAFASLTSRPISTDLTREVLQDLFPDNVRTPITIEQIQAAVCSFFGVSLGELKGDKRHQAVVYPRQIAMYLARELTDTSLPKIGAKFGGRDHTTVIYATSKIARVMKEDREAYNVVQELTARVKRGR
jgi:chromosomal replication initiator protein